MSESRIKPAAAGIATRSERSPDDMPAGSPEPAESAALEQLRHDLSVHQAELEVQNEQLRQTQLELEASLERFRDLYEHAPVGYLSFDFAGQIAQANRMASSLFALPANRVVGRRVIELVAAEDRVRFMGELVKLARGEGPRLVEVRLDRPGGGLCWVAMHMQSVAGREGMQCRAAVTDVTEQVGLQEARARLAAIVESSEDAIVSRDTEGRVTSWNAAAEQLFGFSAAEMLGATMDALVPPARKQEERALLQRLAQGEAIASIETERMHRDDRRLDLSISFSPTRERTGKVTGHALIARDISARRALEQALKDRDRMKDDFIATLAHELRNPLAPISNAIAILRQPERADPQRIAWCRDIIGRQVEQMTRLLEELLDVSRLTRNRIELRRSRTTLAEAIERAVEVNQSLLDASRHRLAIDLPAEPVVLHADKLRLTQVFANLLNNAAKYTEPGGTIAITARRVQNLVRVSIRDSGIGIDKDQLAHVFDMFSQLTPALERARGGLGIGLALTRGLVELHGGTVQARSDGIGQGAEFVVELPVLPAEDSSNANAAEQSVAYEQEGARPRRVLIADDNVDAAESLGALLRLYGHDVRLAFGGREALAVAEQWRPDALVLDIGMHDLNGYELCERIRRQAWGAHSLLIACTGFGQPADRDRARAAGFDHHIVKPVAVDTLLQLLSQSDKE